MILFEMQVSDLSAERELLYLTWNGMTGGIRMCAGLETRATAELEFGATGFELGAPNSLW